MVDALGTKYAFPASLDFGQGTGDGAVGNVSLQFREGRLSGSRTFAASVDPLTGYVVGVPATTRGYSLRLNKRIGYFGGRFLHEDGTRPLYRGILLNKGANRGGFGFFRSAGPGGQSGAVTLDPDGP